MTKFYYTGAYCGAGKTERAIRKMAEVEGRYIYAVDRVEEFAIRRERLVEAADRAGKWPTIRSLSRQAGDLVTRDFPLAVEEMGNNDHCVLIITHEAMKLVDHSVVAGMGWSIIIDEDPKIWSHATFAVKASDPFWRETYNLEPFSEGFSIIRPKADAPTWKEIMGDDLTRLIAPFHARLNRGQTVVNIGSWDDLPDRRQFSYFAIWDVSELLAYDEVTFLANAFPTLVTFRLIRALHPEIDLIEIPIEQTRQWLPRDVTINYVATQHRAGSYFFTTDEGKIAIDAWSKWVASTVDPVRHYWSANKVRFGLPLPGERVSPKIAGSNLYRNLTQCSVLYTAKAAPAENRVFSLLSENVIDADTVMRDREYEDLIQIVFRSSLRMPEDDRPVTLNVYDREQAEFLQGYLREAGFPFRVKVQHVDLGIDVPALRRGKKVDPAKPPMTNAERQRAFRERQRAKAEAPPPAV